MKAIVHSVYGPPDLLELQEIDKPIPKDDELLVRVHAAGVNPLDWHTVAGMPYVMRAQGGLRRPKSTAIGNDFAGTVEAVGRNVTRFRPGDDVFGARTGAFAEYVCVREERMVLTKPDTVTVEQAAAVPVAALTALQALRDTGRIRPGQKVLVNGAGGGIGTFAVQLATSFGAHVTGVCGTDNVELVRSIGAERVIDYTRQAYPRGGERYDMVLDLVGNHSLADRRSALKPDGVLVAVVTGPKGGRWLGPLAAIPRMVLTSAAGSRKLRPMFAKLVKDDLITLRRLLEAREVTPVIGRRYALSEVPKAIDYVGGGHTRGKVVITVPTTD